MANGKITLGKQSGGTLGLVFPDGVTNTEVVLPESGELATKEYVDNGAGATFVANDTRVKTALNASGTAPIYACRAWVNFNGTGTVAIRASGNVSSITDNGTGDYTVNFTTAMPDENTSFAVSGRRTDLDVPAIVSLAYLYVPNVNNVRIISTNNVNDSKIDTNSIFVEAFR